MLDAIVVFMKKRKLSVKNAPVIARIWFFFRNFAAANLKLNQIQDQSWTITRRTVLNAWAWGFDTHKKSRADPQALVENAFLKD